MKTRIQTQADAVTLVAACFPFSGGINKNNYRLRHQHFKRKQHE